MPALVRIHQPVDARVEQGELDRRYIEVDVDFAARLQTRHTRRFECTARETPGGREQFTRDVPNVGEDGLAQLDDAGLIKLGSEVESGTILVGRVTPRVGPTLSPEEKLLRAIFGEAASEVVDASLRSPAWCGGIVTDARITTGADGLDHAIVELEWERPLALGDVLLIADEPVVIAGIRRLAADLAWAGGVSQVAVAKAATAVDVLHARSIGPYSPTTQQPRREREQWGG
jgi:DNA-directed RNA polymerase beta subunit